jgi:hypothetical protein
LWRYGGQCSDPGRGSRPQNLYGQAKNTAGDAAISYANDAYQNSGETLRDGSQAVAETMQNNSLGALLIAGGIGFALAGCGKTQRFAVLVGSTGSR